MFPAILFSVVLLATTFLLGAIAVRVMGETGIEPVSGTSFIVLLMLLLVFLNFPVGLSKEESILMALVGTVFGSAISMSGTVVGDYKNSLYIGNRPYHISKGNILGVIPGAILGAGVAIFLSKLLAEGSIDLQAPQANAFASFTIILAEGQGDWIALGLGFCIRRIHRMGYWDGHFIRVRNVSSNSNHISYACRRCCQRLVGETQIKSQSRGN